MFYFGFRTRRGPIYIVPQDGRWIVLYKDENLGSYHSPDAAASDCHHGALFTPSDGNMFDDYEIPEDLSEWERLPLRWP